MYGLRFPERAAICTVQEDLFTYKTIHCQSVCVCLCANVYLPCTTINQIRNIGNQYQDNLNRVARVTLT